MRFDYIEAYKDDSGQWRWRGKAKNGKILADSGESYASAGNLRRALTRRSIGRKTPLRVLSQSKFLWPSFV